MATNSTKREKNFEREYSDNSGDIGISHNDDTVVQAAMTTIHPDVVKRAAMRYVADILVGVGNAALKAEGGTPEKAAEKMAATLVSLQDGTFKFRSASGQGGLSLEEEQAIIAQTLVTLGKASDAAEGLSKVAAVYSRSKTNAKGYTVRPDYNAMKNVPQIKVALANASKAENNLDSILG